MTHRLLSRISSLASVLLMLAVASGPAAAEPDRTADRLCPWGRLSDGKGHLVRCLAEEEVAWLKRSATAAVPPVAAAAPAAAAPAAAAPAAAAPAAAAPAAAAPAAAAPAPAVPPEPLVVVEIGAPVVDAGGLPDAVKSLKKATDRLAECVDRNGGLLSERGDVEVRFMVQGRGRAEGVSVKRFRSLTEAAAKCVANVVDRRYVGYPEEPMVGASLAISFTKKKR